jgi:hypothetical protein
MCDKNSKNNYTNSLSSDQHSHAQWLNNLIITLVQKVNENIYIQQMKNYNLMLKNIAETDLPKLSFLTNTAKNNNYGRVTGMGVSIAGQNGTALPVKIPGLTQAIVKAYNDSDSQAFLNGSKTFKPFVAPFTDPVTSGPMSVSEYVDQQTASNPSLPKTTWVKKTYTIIFSPIKKNIRFRRNQNLAGGTAGGVTTNDCNWKPIPVPCFESGCYPVTGSYCSTCQSTLFGGTSCKPKMTIWGFAKVTRPFPPKPTHKSTTNAGSTTPPSW